ncbi:MHYT domain-containing protein [Roseiterribacter gracilis]|uniref:histidine kinase n=1 Tax=Roseiterribacter gracilis TaxID=2812848 RepID=A0A8S8X9S8_9PROT|nr:hypothetical protein TMPK1_03240 [Rhodospirillales bacterium TMPK1]
MLNHVEGTGFAALDASYDHRLVVLSLIVAVVASFSALTFAEHAHAAPAQRRRAWLLVAAMALGGGIWTMHFIGMLALQLPTTIAYQPGLTLLSGLIAIAAVAAGFDIVDRARGRLPSLFVAGAVVGLGVAAMHNIGMLAVHSAALVVYDIGMFALSVGIAIAAATAALAIVWTERTMFVRAVAALLMAAAIAGMHYTGMEAAQFMPDATRSVTPDGVDRIVLGLWIAAAFLIGSFFALGAVWLEHQLATREATAINRRDRRYQALAQHTMVVTMLLDEAGYVRFEIGPVDRFFGVKSGSLLNRRLRDKVPGIEKLDTSLESLAATGGGAMLQHDIDLTHGDGRRVTLEVKLQDQRDQPDLAGYLVQLHDVTEARRFSEALELARDVAERATRTKNEFLANISHELRTPIHIGNGFAQMLRDHADDLAPEQVREYADEICRSNDRLMQSVSDLIALSQLETGNEQMEEEPVDPRGLLTLLARRLEPNAEAADLRISVSTDAVSPILGDERRLSYALMHLIDNAIKFSPKGESIELAARCNEDGDMRFTVSDHGVGMSSDDIARAIESFTQLDGTYSRVAEGLGLGLAIARRVAERHDGRLEIESHEGAGTSVSLIVPARRVLQIASAA